MLHHVQLVTSVTVCPSVRCVDVVNVISVLSKNITVKKIYFNSDMDVYYYISKNFIIM